MGLTDNVSVLCFAVAATSVTYMSSFRGPEHIYTFNEDDLQTFRRQGILIVRDQMFDRQRLENITQESLLRVKNRPEGKRPEDLLNLHQTGDEYILSLAKDPKVVKIAARLLGSPEGVKIFSTRILCKMPGTGQPVPWHQDSSYWPLTEHKAVSMWLALDDANLGNGGMKMYNFSAMPETRENNLPMRDIKGIDDTKEQFGAFFQELDYPLEDSAALAMELKRGQAEFHDSFILHSSGPNESGNRRCAWIARYVAAHVELVRGVRDVFDENYHLVYVAVED